MMMKRRTLFGTALAAGMAPAVLRAEARWPNRPIRLIVPYTPGGVADTVGRLVANGMQEKLGQPIVVENRGGANGTIGSDVAAKSTPDGYTFLLVVSAHVINPWIMPQMPYKPLEDLRGVSMVADIPMLAVSSAALPPKNLTEFIAYAKAAREPVLYASSGIGSGAHLATEMFARAAGIPLQHVPYRGIAPALPDLFSGRIALILDTIQTMQTYIEAGRLYGLGLSSDTRWPTAPNLPTFAEAGLPGFKASSWFSLLAPSQMPNAIVEEMSHTVAAVLEMPATKERLHTYGLIPNSTSPTACDTFLRSESERWGRVAREADIRIDG